MTRMTHTPTVRLDLYPTVHDDGYRVRDWFESSALTHVTQLTFRDLVPDDEEPTDPRRALARAIRDYLRRHYLGPDVDGVQITGRIHVDHVSVPF